MSISIEVRNGNVEKAMRILKRKVQKEGLIQTLRDKQYYQKPSFRRREKIKTAKRMVAKLQKEKDAMNGIVIVKGKKVKRI